MIVDRSSLYGGKPWLAIDNGRSRRGSVRRVRTAPDKSSNGAGGQMSSYLFSSLGDFRFQKGESSIVSFLIGPS
jgi:hypothetical protein